MNNPPVIITQHVINTIKALSDLDRRAIAEALINEFVLGLDPEEGLSPFQAMLYVLISHYVKRDSIRGANVVKNVV